MKSILAKKNLSCLLIIARRNREVVIGVPHHAPAGQPFLNCPTHRDSDENTGYLGYYIAKKLKCCCIIACNYHFDVNKSLNSDYAVHIAEWSPKYLIEIHGHGANSTNFKIEISCGIKKRNRFSVQLAEMLQKSWAENPTLNEMTVSGDYNKIALKAHKTATVVDKRWIPFHIELPSELRIDPENKEGKPPEAGYRFCDYFIESLKEMRLV